MKPRRSRSCAFALALASIAFGGCFGHERASGGAASEPELGDPIQFGFGTIEGGELSSDTTRGRTTALLFVTTYDLPSQAEALLLRDALATHKPLASGAIVMLEAPQTAELARVWADSIGLRLPIAMAGPSVLAGESPLGQIVGVPTLIVLDRRGRLIEKHEGALSRAEIEQTLSRADRR